MLTRHFHEPLEHNSIRDLKSNEDHLPLYALSPNSAFT